MGVRKLRSPTMAAKVTNTWDFECIRKGKIVWREKVKNLVVGSGLDMLLWATIKQGLPPTPQWYVGLINNAGFVQFIYTDTMASHPGWVESALYNEATRFPYVPGDVANAYVDNAGTRAAFTINTNHSVRGAFLTSFNNKGGNTGILYGEAAFASPRLVNAADTLLIKLACQITSS